MMDLGSLAFGAPLALIGFAALPVLWWLLRITPPLPRTQVFPPLRLLVGLAETSPTSAHTPWWLLVLRMVALALALIGLAQPILSPESLAVRQRPLLVVIDDTWSAANGWSARQKALAALLDHASTQQRPLAVLTTAPPVDGTAVTLQTFETANAAKQALSELRPKAWGSDHRAARMAVEHALSASTASSTTLLSAADVVWFSDGLSSQHASTPDAMADVTAAPAETQALAEVLQRLGSLTVRIPQPTQATNGSLSPLLVVAPQRLPDGVRVMVRRPVGLDSPDSTRLEALDEQGRALASADIAFASGQHLAEAELRLPSDGVNILSSLRLAPASGEVPGAGGVFLLGDHWRHHPVGLLSSGGTQTTAGGSLLAAETYITRALPPEVPLFQGPLEALLQHPIQTMIAVDPLLDEHQHAALSRWVQNGGVLIRFAGPTLAAQPARDRLQDDLLAVPVRSGNRALGGSLSWTPPLSLSGYPPHSPLTGLPVPKDVTIRTQILADPSAAIASGADLDRRTWATLSDGTPLITGAPVGHGWVVLVHTSADPSWSNLPLSGLYPAMLTRLVGLGRNATTAETGAGIGAGAQTLLPPAQDLNGLGRLVAPSAFTRPLTLSDPQAAPEVQAPHHPPGLYGQAGQRVALNLGSLDRPLPPLPSFRSGVTVTGLTAQASPSTDLRPPFLLAALLLLVLESVLTLALRGLLPRLKPHTTGGIRAFLLLGLGLSLAGFPSNARAADSLSVIDALATRLAYIATGSPTLDATSAGAMRALSAAISARTAVSLAEPVALQPGRDDPLFFPLIYWPIQDDSALLLVTPERIQQLAHYREQGGLLVIDGQGPDSEPAVAAVVEALGLGTLSPLPKDHVLNRAFYISALLPGRANGSVWIEPPENRLDGVSTVIAGTNAWGQAWAKDDKGYPMFPMISGGERTRELAYRSGVNILLYALTGTYKADQIHLPSLLERLPQ